MHLSRSSTICTLIALVALRVVVGLHFFNEGMTKVQSGSFDASGFLAQARGPAADFFHNLTDDYDGRLRLGISQDPVPQIDTRPAIAIWEEWLEMVSNRHEFNPDQREAARQILETGKRELADFYQEHEVEIVAWARGSQRLDGFDRDGPQRRQAAREVESLHDQVGQIARQRRQDAGVWFASIEAIWDNFREGVSDLAPDQELMPLPKPWAPANSRLAIINRCLPWFDLGVGLLLILGLATRIAALAGMGLLAGVLATQPFWIPGTENTFYQWIEFSALFVIMAVGAGRLGGLDYFLTRSGRPPAREETEPV